jgi:hypothetical protein
VTVKKNEKDALCSTALTRTSPGTLEFAITVKEALDKTCLSLSRTEGHQEAQFDLMVDLHNRMDLMAKQFLKKDEEIAQERAHMAQERIQKDELIRVQQTQLAQKDALIIKLQEEQNTKQSDLIQTLRTEMKDGFVVQETVNENNKRSILRKVTSIYDCLQEEKEKRDADFKASSKRFQIANNRG